jgi:hypothetical protein
MSDQSSIPKSTIIEKPHQIEIPPQLSVTRPNVRSDLDLEWTRISRCKSLSGDCCIDNIRKCSLPAQRLEDDLLEGSSQSFVEGVAIFCIPDLDSTWFQGYFTRNGSNGKPIGLLVSQNMNTDECLQCSDGGYKELTLRLCRRTSSKLRSSKSDIFLENIVCTGGDMMQWKGNNISFHTERLWTGSNAIPIVERYFSGLVQKIRSCSIDENSDTHSFDLLQWLPDVVVNVGTLKMILERDDERDYWDSTP